VRGWDQLGAIGFSGVVPEPSRGGDIFRCQRRILVRAVRLTGTFLKIQYPPGSFVGLPQLWRSAG
jgi:hypothetical protein